MPEKKYKNIISHYEDCFDKHGDNHKGMDWPNAKDAELRYQIMLEVIRNPNEAEINLLDFGCGVAHLYEYILRDDMFYKNISYSGSDISEKFISICKEKYPNNKFYCIDILAKGVDDFPCFDYIVLNGVFTEKCNLTEEEMWEYFKDMIQVIFKKTNHGIAFNVMSKAVDWERDDLFHLSLDKLVNFLTDKLSRNFVIRNDYGLYEYTVYLYK